jgi:hypothetical protein
MEKQQSKKVTFSAESQNIERGCTRTILTREKSVFHLQRFDAETELICNL